VPRADFFQRLGLFAAPGFLDDDLCRRLQAAMDRGQRLDGTIGTGGAAFAVDPTYRRTKVVDVDDELPDEVRERLLACRPAIAAHYDVALSDCQRPQFLAYGPGDFYKPHRDVNHEGAATSQARRIAAVIFLNPVSDTPAPGCYGGGALTFFEWLTDPAGRDVGLPLEAEPGLLITFRAEALHAVSPVTHGERRTIVSWFTS
jgi:SM-20-related protein